MSKKSQKIATAFALVAAMGAGGELYATTSLSTPTQPTGTATTLVQPPMAETVAQPQLVAVVQPQADKTPARECPSVIEYMESKNQRYDSKGDIIISNKGAIGEMQVLPTTAIDPGYGVAPAADNSPDEFARVGNDYCTALINRYHGNLGMAFAAYNAGPIKVNEAIREARRHHRASKWLSYLPHETRMYVKNGLALVRQQKKNKPVVMIASR